MNINKSAIWCEKYRPTDISGYIFHDDTHRKTITKMVSDGIIPHLLLSGIQGSGKTTLAKLLCTELGVDDMDVMILNASDENSVDVMRDKLKSFVSTYAMGEFKVVILDEADYISQPGQAILRHMLENNSDNVRFILTCNYENKIINPLKSRLQHLRFKAPNVDDVTELVATILMKENVTFDLDALDAYIEVGYPDVRKIINLLQQNTADGELSSPTSTESEASDYKFDLLDLIERGNWTAARTLVCANVLGEDWYGMYKFLYENLHKAERFSESSAWDQGMLVIAEHAYKHEMVAAPEINATALFIQLSLI